MEEWGLPTLPGMYMVTCMAWPLGRPLDLQTGGELHLTMTCKPVQSLIPRDPVVRSQKVLAPSPILYIRVSSITF